MTTKKLISVLTMLMFFSINTWAQGPNDTGTYYENADGYTGQTLKTKLYTIISNSLNVVSYSNLINKYEETDVRSDGYLRDWYSNSTNYIPGSSPGSYSKEGDTYNREHLVPQSWFGKGSPMKSDIVHVVPTDGYVNNRRSNYILAEVGTTTYTSDNNYSKLGTSSVSGYTGTVFEPNDEIKGDIARIYFYMATCYQDKISSWANNATASDVFDGNTYPGIKNWYLNMLMEWSAKDPVDEVEIARNNAVYGVQNNRNPFVDYPGLEDYIWGEKNGTAFSYDNYNGTSDVVSKPTFSPKAGTYTTTQNVAISCATSGATIYYAIGNGTYSTYTSGTTITVSETTTIKAYAEKDGTSSSVATATYTITDESITSDNTFVKVTSTDQITIGGEYIFINEENKKVAGALSSDYLTAVDVSISSNVATLEDNSTALVFTLGGSNNSYSFKTDNKYLHTSEAKKISLSSSESKIWTISSSNDGFIVSTNNYGTIQYNKANPRFTNYTSSQNPAVLYYKTNVDSRQEANISYSETSFEVEEEEDFDAPTLVNPYNLTITYSSSNEEVATVNSSTGYVVIGKPGTATITATFAGNTDYKPASASYSITVTEIIDSSISMIETTATFNFPQNNYGMTAYSGSSNNYNPNPTTISSGEVQLTMTGSNASRYWQTSSSSYELRVYKSCSMTISVPEGAYITQIVFAGNTVTGIQYEGSSLSNNTWTGNLQSVGFTFSNTQQINTISVTYYKECASVKIGSTGYATLYYGTKNLVIPEGVTASKYYVTDGKLTQGVTYESGQILAAGTAVVLEGTEGTYNFEVTSKDGVVDDGVNMLYGFDEASTTVGPETGVDYMFYKLCLRNGSTDPNTVGFYWGAADGGAFTSKAHKAYLVVPASSSAKVGYPFDNTTGLDQIEKVENTEDLPMYDLQGRKVNRGSILKKGIYIVGGKKIVVK